MYLLSIITVIAATLIICAFSSHGLAFLLYFIDPVSIMLLVLLTVPMLIASHLLKDFNNAFRLALNKEKDTNLTEIRRSIEAVDLVMKVLLFAGIFICIFCLLMTMTELEDLSQLGPRVAVAMVDLLYAFGIDLFLLPLKSKLKVKLMEYMQK